MAVLMVCVWFGVVLMVRFPADVAPEKWLLAEHRGSNRLPEERKTETEISSPAANDKAKNAVFLVQPRIARISTNGPAFPRTFPDSPNCGNDVTSQPSQFVRFREIRGSYLGVRDKSVRCPSQPVAIQTPVSRATIILIKGDSFYQDCCGRTIALSWCGNLLRVFWISRR
jgi:hypothetical protein